MQTLSPSAPTKLTEQCEDWASELAIDDSKRLVKNIALSGLTSRNGYSYSEDSLREAVSLYTNKPVFLDHAHDKTRPQDRSTRDLVGHIINAHFEEGRIRGDIRVLETESGETFLKLVESQSPGVGMSHVVLAQRSADGSTVDRIEDVISVDAVINPATTKTFHESHQQSDETQLLTEQLRTISKQRDSLLQERDNLRRSLSTMQKEQSLQRLLREAELPAVTITEPFLAQLRKADSDAERQSLIQDRKLLIESHSTITATPHSHPRHHNETSTNASFVNAIKSK